MAATPHVNFPIMVSIYLARGHQRTYNLLVSLYFTLEYLMARVTVEDCVDKIPNRFELVMMAAQRARGISAGAALTLDRDHDKNPVVSLREIAEASVSVEELEEEVINTLQTFIAMDEPEADEMDLLAVQQGLNTEMSGDSASVAVLGDDPTAVAGSSGEIITALGNDERSA